MEVYVDDESKLTLHGLQQHYVKLKDNEKNRKLFELLDVLEFNQVCIILCLTNFSVLIVKLYCPGRHFREICATLYGPVSIVGRAEFPSHCYPPQYDSGGTSISLPAIQRFQKGI